MRLTRNIKNEHWISYILINLNFLVVNKILKLVTFLNQ